MLPVFCFLRAIFLTGEFPSMSLIISQFNNGKHR
jgi:hypothetical protein